MEYTNVKYEGGKSFGRFCGYGELDLPDGNRYEGEFFNGQFHGSGTLFFREGKLEGKWEHGKVRTNIRVCVNVQTLICGSDYSASGGQVHILRWS
ncbi:hypothetical protein PINS_up003941 [Pythium insidiosum]|nr:hypothetical protein PINS_up003941 [Pythium insidiosum]